MAILRKLFLISGILLPVIVGLRILYVDWQYDTQPVKETIYSDGGYVASDVYGHGDLRFEDGALSWVIFDSLGDNGRIRKTCVKGVLPDSSFDVDFVYHNGLWYKLRSGTGLLRADGFTSNPETHLYGGWLETPLVFPVKRPPLAYQVKILRDKFFGRGTSPRQYLQYLKKSNPSCFDMPET